MNYSHMDALFGSDSKGQFDLDGLARNREWVDSEGHVLRLSVASVKTRFGLIRERDPLTDTFAILKNTGRRALIEEVVLYDLEVAVDVKHIRFGPHCANANREVRV
jgi:hypothetical protein